jgi:hypothetical protein
VIATDTVISMGIDQQGRFLFLPRQNFNTIRPFINTTKQFFLPHQANF